MKYIEVSDAIETTWMVLRGLGYRKEENPQLEQTVCEVFATAPSADGKRMDKEENEDADLKPCPFCGAVLKYDEYVALTLPGKPIMRLWAHPPGKCILSGLEISKEDHEAWNRRAEE